VSEQQAKVTEFHQKLGFTINETPTLVPVGLGMIRHKDTLKEMDELARAILNGDLVEIADALGDVKYLIRGTAVTYGIPIDRVFDEIHRSNMTKERPPGGGDAKAVKGKDYSPPDLSFILSEAR